jgi:hypothetical protein
MEGGQKIEMTQAEYDAYRVAFIPSRVALRKRKLKDTSENYKLHSSRGVDIVIQGGVLRLATSQEVADYQGSVPGAKDVLHFRTDPESRTKIEQLVARLTRRGGTMKFFISEGKAVTANLSRATQLRDIVEDHEAACLERGHDLIAAIREATTKVELEAIDTSMGWPNNLAF